MYDAVRRAKPLVGQLPDLESTCSKAYIKVGGIDGFCLIKSPVLGSLSRPEQVPTLGLMPMARPCIPASTSDKYTCKHSVRETAMYISALRLDNIQIYQRNRNRGGGINVITVFGILYTIQEGLMVM